jgi:hypothetical protein
MKFFLLRMLGSVIVGLLVLMLLIILPPSFTTFEYGGWKRGIKSRSVDRSTTRRDGVSAASLCYWDLLRYSLTN